MLDFIYRGNLQLPPVDNDMTPHLLAAADRFDLGRLKSICAERLHKQIDSSTVATTLELALRYGCHALKDACLDFLAPHKGNLKAFLKSEGLEQLVTDYPSIALELLARV
jgi:speckle-type POZ protein